MLFKTALAVKYNFACSAHLTKTISTEVTVQMHINLNFSIFIQGRERFIDKKNMICKKQKYTPPNPKISYLSLSIKPIVLAVSCQVAISDQIQKERTTEEQVSMSLCDGPDRIFHLIMNGWQIMFNAFIQHSGDTWSGSNYCITHDLIVKNETSIT